MGKAKSTVDSVVNRVAKILTRPANGDRMTESMQTTAVYAIMQNGPNYPPFFASNCR